MAQRCIPHDLEIQHAMPPILPMELQVPDGQTQTYSEHPCTGQSLAPNLSGAGPNSTSDNGGSFGHQARGKRRRTAADPPVDTVPTASASQVCDRTGFPHAGSPVPLVQLQLGSVSEQQSEAKVMEPHGSTAQTRPHPASPGALSAVSQDPSFPAVDASEAMAINIGDGGDNSGDGAGGPVHTGGRPIMTASATPLHPPPLPHANRHMPHHHHDTLLPPSGASPEPSVLSTAAPATTTATATTPAPQPWPGFEPPRPPLPPLPPYQHQHPHQHRDLFDSGRLQQQQQQHLFPSGGAAAEAGAAPQAGFAGLAGAGGFGGALAAIPTAGWAEPIRQLYALLDYVALQEAMVSGRLTTLRVHWINQPPALVHQAVEVRKGRCGNEGGGATIEVRYVIECAPMMYLSHGTTWNCGKLRTLPTPPLPSHSHSHSHSQSPLVNSKSISYTQTGTHRPLALLLHYIRTSLQFPHSSLQNNIVYYP
ncbi:hypothetical protein Vafri_21021 [Volvox africanus]|uniref:Uncharacterized protein n=1 Tax=Volvox africanus TaxID=51714 RepID=A0A8J4BSS4_9CHLO|nr:hypothetical protein Vafri_21021 [Volvox africanus]